MVFVGGNNSGIKVADASVAFAAAAAAAAGGGSGNSGYFQVAKGFTLERVFYPSRENKKLFARSCFNWVKRNF